MRLLIDVACRLPVHYARIQWPAPKHVLGDSGTTVTMCDHDDIALGVKCKAEELLD